FKGAHDDFSLQQLFEHDATVADVYHHEIRDGRHERNSHFGKSLLQKSAAFVHDPLRLAQIRFIAQRCDRAGLRDAVYIEWLPRLVRYFDQIARRNAVADSQASKAMNLRKRPQHNDVSSFADKPKRVGRIIEEFEIRFVENDDDAVRNLGHEPLNRALRN